MTLTNVKSDRTTASIILVSKVANVYIELISNNAEPNCEMFMES
jgi:hypothetical protein